MAAIRGVFASRVGIVSLLAGSLALVLAQQGRVNGVNAEAMLDASVTIRAISHVEIDRFGDSVWRSQSGSGVLVSKARCEVWTNHHVVAEAAFIEIRPRGWTAAFGIPATVVNATPHSDIAILRMEYCEGIEQASLADSDTVRPGDDAYAVGNPLGENPDSITRGIISHTERYANGPVPFLQTDAAINRGSSGGALFNRDGEVIGLSTAIAAGRDGGNIGIGYAIPINVVKAVAKQLAAGPPSWGDAGIDDLISNLTSDEAEIFGVPRGHRAVSLSKAPAEGPAVGKLRARDAIFKLDDTPVTGVAQMRRIIAGHEAGEPITFHLVRAGEVMAVDVALDEGWKSDDSPQADYYEGYLGMKLEMWAERPGELGQFKSPVIAQVHSLGPAHRGRIASSQRTAGFAGTLLVPYQLDVKTVTGAVLRGDYHAVATPEELERLAERAYETSDPLLLEIELWGRADPRRPEGPLKHYGTAFYKIVPKVTTAAAPGSLEEAPGRERAGGEHSHTVSANAGTNQALAVLGRDSGR